jgi:hypothetical protein
VLEARARFGGRAASHRHHTLFLNQGPHALYLAGSAMRELGALGIDPPGWNRTAGQLYIRNGELRSDIGGSEALRRWLESVARGRCDDDLATTSVSEWLDRSLEGVDREAAGAFVRLTTLVADTTASAPTSPRSSSATGSQRESGTWMVVGRRWSMRSPRRRGAAARRCGRAPRCAHWKRSPAAGW